MKARFINITVAVGVEKDIQEVLSDPFFTGYYHLSFVDFKEGDGYTIVTLKTMDAGINIPQIFYMLGRRTVIKESYK